MVVVVCAGKELLVEVEVDRWKTIDRHGVQQLLPPVVGAVFDVGIGGQEHTDVFHSRHGVTFGGRQSVVDARALDDDEPMFFALDVQLPRGAELQHAELAGQKGGTQQADDTFALLDRLLDASKDHATQGEVTGMVAHPVPAAIPVLHVPAFQTVDDTLGLGIVWPRA